MAVTDKDIRSLPMTHKKAIDVIGLIRQMCFIVKQLTEEIAAQEQCMKFVVQDAVRLITELIRLKTDELLKRVIGAVSTVLGQACQKFINVRN